MIVVGLNERSVAGASSSIGETKFDVSTDCRHLWGEDVRKVTGELKIWCMARQRTASFVSHQHIDNSKHRFGVIRTDTAQFASRSMQIMQPQTAGLSFCHLGEWLMWCFSPLETISTSLWASLYHHLTVLSVFSHVSCQFVFGHIFSVVVGRSQSRSPPSSLPRYDHVHHLLHGRTNVIVFVSGTLTFGTLWHPLVLSCFSHGPFCSYPLSIVASFPLHAICSRLSF